MKVLLLKDVYNLGRAGDVKKVANGYGRNYLVPQRFATLATPKALEQTEIIREEAEKERAIRNKEMESVANQLKGIVLHFPSKAGETGKLYGSITSQMIADAVNENVGGEVISRRNIEIQPIRTLGEHKAEIRLTLDLIPVIDILVYREGESPSSLFEESEDIEETSETTEEAAETGEEVTETVEEEAEAVEEVTEAVEELTEIVEETPESNDLPKDGEDS
ncbi:MAG: 50S ribosomal protein L9 [Anaerolineaceae bacterium]|nr:50S ribosomal protein L9 [Anaerolineaceae bacterium]